MTTCWCGSTEFLPFSPEYAECSSCGTLVSLVGLSPAELLVNDDDTDFYGKSYWLGHQSDELGFPDIYKRARADLTERNLHWLKALMKYRLPGAKVLELGCSHGSFVALMRQAGYDASGVEMSPWVVDFAKKTFDVPVSLGPVENLEIPSGSYDVIALMDVLEHLPDPSTTMAHCLSLLKPDGLLLVQTPQFKSGMKYAKLMEIQGAFLEMLKSDEHLYLFTDGSATRLFGQLGAEHIQFEPAIFGHYDMFFAVSKAPLHTYASEEAYAALEAIPRARMALALLDMYARETSSVAQLIADKSHLSAQFQASEADRAARLEVIEARGSEIDKVTAELEAVTAKLAELRARLSTTRAERSQLKTSLSVDEAELAELDANLWIRIGRKLGIVPRK
jgi:SAM-dependent methyltransferase